MFKLFFVLLKKAGYDGAAGALKFPSNDQSLLRCTSCQWSATNDLVSASQPSPVSQLTVLIHHPDTNEPCTWDFPITILAEIRIAQGKQNFISVIYHGHGVPPINAKIFPCQGKIYLQVIVIFP